jgi:hypothetical protein
MNTKAARAHATRRYVARLYVVYVVLYQAWNMKLLKSSEDTYSREEKLNFHRLDKECEQLFVSNPF